MRYDLRILWIEDTATFFEDAKDILEMFADDQGIKLDFEYVQDAEKFAARMKMDSIGFKLFDLIFVDYTLSSDIVGSSVIRDLRSNQLDTDILFYSSEHEADIRTTIIDDLGSYEGVYVANRFTFNEKACYLINKNARRLTSLANIRGFLMDQTSENDFTMKSYIQQNFAKLNLEQKAEVSKMLRDFIASKSEVITSKATEQIAALDTNGITNINKTMGLMGDLFPIDLKYQIFQKMVGYLGDDEFSEVTIDTYTSEIIKARNTLAHKKVDVCRMQSYVLYADTMKQLKARSCPEDCTNHDDSNKYSLDQWRDIRSKVLKFGDEIDKLQMKLLE